MLVTAAALAALYAPGAAAQVAGGAACRPGHAASLRGTVRDSSLALIPGAALTVDGGTSLHSGADGRFAVPCLSAGKHTLVFSSPGFASLSVDVHLPHPGEVLLTLQPDTVQTSVEVNADGDQAAAGATNGPTETLSGSQLQSLADDPDDLQRELQQLAASTGASPANVTISVDGFQDSSKVPPKSSIAYIKVNPDLYSAEYREPPFEGGRVEIYTKPGQSAFHGALFATNGSPWMNARDPFSVSRAPLGKQRYGFELTGPIRRQGSDFALDLEHRSIDNFAVVNAVTLDAAGNPQNVIANVPTPQRLWEGQARVDWQLGAKNTFIASYSPNVNSLQNLGVGGTNLAETGYSSGQYEHVLRFTDITVISARLMHEARVQLRWDGETDVPTSTAPQLQVAGSFTSGGATTGNQRVARFVPEIDDDAILTTGKHTLKVGTQFNLYHDRLQSTTDFNGTYTFGGSDTAPVLDAHGAVVAGQTETIAGIEQYRRALLHLSGGTPTAFTDVTGTPAISFYEVTNALYIQDDWNVGKGVHLSSGVRYYVQSLPGVFNGATPRLGVLWSPTKKGTWTLHAHAGLFVGRTPPRVPAEILRADGTDRVFNLVYNPVLGDPLTAATSIHTARAFAPHYGVDNYSIQNIGGTRSLPGGWNLSADYYFGRLWNEVRSVNINSPLNGDPLGPRALGIPNLNLLQANNSGQGRANVEFLGIEQHKLKFAQLFFGGVHADLRDDTDDNEFFTPQSAFSDAGEFAYRTGDGVWQLFGNGTFTLPEKVKLSGNFHASGDAHYNITTGFDNNGDGVFNDRPQYAAPGTPESVSTPFGLLVATGGVAVFPRNRGVMPWQFYLDTNLQRAFVLTRNAKAEHQQTLTVNVRSANVLNHTNVTSVGGVLGSPLFTVPYAADNGRRVEAGLRYSF